jgi:2-iminobutanoate/2-iminopropanoate deaminase
VEKSVVKSDVPALGVPLNMAVRYGDLLFVSGIPPFREAFASQLRAARESGTPLPRFPDMPFEEQATVVMDHLKQIVEAAGSTMDHLLKVNVWLKSQSDAPVFDRVYRRYFSSQQTLPARTRLQAGHADGLRARGRGDWIRTRASQEHVTERGIASDQPLPYVVSGLKSVGVSNETLVAGDSSFVGEQSRLGK